MNRRLLFLPVLFSGSLMLSACGSPTTSTASNSTATSAPPAIASVTRDLVVTPAVRSSLLDAAAAYHQLPPSDYVGLDPGTTYYAYDPTTNRYFAAAGLRPSSTSMAAQVGTQDDGAYNLFTRAAGTRTWTVYNDGLGGVQGTKCPLAVPSTVLKVWGWKSNTCYPPS
ncbi:MAG TPA: hypothetical protein VNF05_05860 [Acidimicrobiales bacterium]|nr:hypothetical protein [Acidimicrobiales bacterium]